MVYKAYIKPLILTPFLYTSIAPYYYYSYICNSKKNPPSFRLKDFCIINVIRMGLSGDDCGFLPVYQWVRYPPAPLFTITNIQNIDLITNKFEYYEYCV